MHRFADMMHIPYEILGYVFGGMFAAASLQATALVPTPDVAAGWPLYGVLITAIVVLFLTIGAILRWVATRWLAQQEANNKIISNMDSTLRKSVETNERMIEWFEEFGKEALKLQLDNGRMSIRGSLGQQEE